MAKVKMYTTETCSYCKAEKEWLKENNIEYEEFDVGSDQEKAQEMIDKSGQMGVPVTEIEGEIIVGFDQEKLEQVLKEKGILK